ncbi:MAG: PhnA protein [Roseivirga sp.]|nr:PhnA protein [Roseivirga sp.]
MSIEQELLNRSESQCELCGAGNGLSSFEVAASTTQDVDAHILTCNTCKTQFENPDQVDPNHWRCLNDSMWSTVPAVQVIAWRMLDRLKDEGWPADLLDMLYLDDETLTWAKAGVTEDDDTDTIVHKDSNGATLQAGDTVVLIKDLNVKGAGFTAKRGTAVRNINLPYDDATHIEGKVNGQTIYILTQFVKKN